MPQSKKQFSIKITGEGTLDEIILAIKLQSDGISELKQIITKEGDYKCETPTIFVELKEL